MERRYYSDFVQSYSSSPQLLRSQFGYVELLVNVAQNTHKQDAIWITTTLTAMNMNRR